MTSEQEQQLLDYLATLGFEGENLAARIHMQAEKNLPLISAGLTKFYGEERMHYDLKLRRDPQFDAYRLERYTVAHRKAVPVEYKVIGGIDTARLEQQMKTVDWQHYFEWGTTVSPEQSGHIRAIADDLAKLGQNKEGKEIADLLQYKYWPAHALDENAPGLQHIYENKASYSSGEYGIVNANLAYHILSGRFDDLFEKFRVLGLEEYPGVDVYPKLEELLATNPDRFEFKCSRNETEGWIDYVVPVEKRDGWYQLDHYYASLISHPAIEHGKFDNIDTRRLEEEMRRIDWHDDKQILSFNEQQEPDLRPEIASISELVYRLSQNMGYADIADQLMLKYWGDATFLDGMIPQTAWDELNERTPRMDEFETDITAKAAFNLLNGRAVLVNTERIYMDEQLTFLRLQLNEPKVDGSYLSSYTDAFKNSELEQQLNRLGISQKRFVPLKDALLRGDLATETMEDGRVIRIETHPETQTLHVYTEDMRPIPVNLRMDPDWRPPVQLHQKEQQQIQPPKPVKNTKPFRRHKGRGI